MSLSRGQCPHPVWSTPPSPWQWGQCPHPVWSTPPSPLAVGSMPSPCVVHTPLPSGSGVNALTLCGPHTPPLWQWGQCPHPVWSTPPSLLAVGSMPSPCVVHTPSPECPHPVWSTPPSPLAVGSMPSPCVVHTPLP